MDEKKQTQDKILKSIKSESSISILGPKFYSVCNNCKLSYTTDTCYRCHKSRKSILSS